MEALARELHLEDEVLFDGVVKESSILTPVLAWVETCRVPASSGLSTRSSTAYQT